MARIILPGWKNSPMPAIRYLHQSSDPSGQPTCNRICRRPVCSPQSRCRQRTARKKTIFCLAHAAQTPWIAGVVGWIPLDRPDEAALMLERFSRKQKFVGVRHLINVEPDPDWIMRSTVIEGLNMLAVRGLTFDYVGIIPRHLEQE